MFVEHPRPCLTTVVLDVKLLRPFQDVDTIFSLKGIEDFDLGYGPVPGKFLDVIGRDPSSDYESPWLHVDIFRLCCHSFEVYAI